MKVTAIDHGQTLRFELQQPYGERLASLRQKQEAYSTADRGFPDSSFFIADLVVELYFVARKAIVVGKAAIAPLFSSHEQVFTSDLEKQTEL